VHQRAIAYTLKAFFGTDKVEFTAVSNQCSPAPCPDRSFSRLSGALKEIVDARVWSGIHFRTAAEQGAELGKEVARWLAEHYFQPTSRGARRRSRQVLGRSPPMAPD
jgi:hypothetical protein